MKTVRLSMAASLMWLLAACGGQDTGKVSLLLKDAPGDFDAAVVTISEIDLLRADGSAVVLSTAKTTTNLLTLANDTATLVDGVNVPSGTYTQLRFVITGGYIAVAQPDGSSIIYASSPTYEGLPVGASVGGTLRMPSYAESGLKVGFSELPGGNLAVGTDAHILVVDFKVSESFGQDAGGSGAWVMHPVVKATEVELTGTVEVSLSQGTVTLPAGVTLGGESGFSAVLTPAGGSAADARTVALGTAVNGTASVAFQYLEPGSYTLSFKAPAGVLSFTTSPDTTTPVSVTVTSGQATPASFTLTSVH